MPKGIFLNPFNRSWQKTYKFLKNKIKIMFDNQVVKTTLALVRCFSPDKTEAVR